uniref:Uncharacterized protein n=2 Tax=Parascaris univalens TaxID=6257 RepID=A0A915AE27_PARUN
RMTKLLNIFLIVNAVFIAAESFLPAQNEGVNAVKCSVDGKKKRCYSATKVPKIVNELLKRLRTTAYTSPYSTSCLHDPCMNGGTCTLVDAGTYRCDCPPEYAGERCEKKLECGQNTCGKNAECSIGNHQITCVCKRGFTGDPLVDCSQRTVTALILGDQHYRTFDGCHFDYMGTCPYYFVVPCDGTLPEPFGRFIIKAKNTFPFKDSSASSLRQIQVEIYGLSLYVDVSTHHLYVDGISTAMPYFYPNDQNATVSVTYINRMVLIHTDTNIVIRFTSGLLSVQIPDVDALRGPDVLCGLAGNIDSNCLNDFRTLDGSTLWNNNCRPKNRKNKFGDSYIITDPNDFFKPDHRDDSRCLRGDELKLPHHEREVPMNVAHKCEEIRNAEYGHGLFAKCQGLHDINESFKDCVHDTCFGSTQKDKAEAHCQALEVFVKLCQSSLPNTPLQWRKEMNCDELNCPTHSTPKMCATACPRTCQNPNPSLQCNEACSEGCECDQGYYLDTSDPAHPECVKLEQCGRNDRDGNHHPTEEIWPSEDCRSINVCKNGTLYAERINCSKNAICERNARNRIHRHSCTEGFPSDGYECVGIDECADPKKCNAHRGHGICLNISGSYACYCKWQYDSDANCEEYRPRRHCADLFLYHNKTKNGVYTIRPFSSTSGPGASREVSVYCDMKTAGGGWTLMSSSLSDSMSNKTFKEYVTGFGDPSVKDVWLGLDIIHQMTKEMNTSLRVNLHYCTNQGIPTETGALDDIYSTYCTYAIFKVLSRSEGYAVDIPFSCRGTDVIEEDGWVRWTNDDRPKFTAFDSANASCSELYRNTGWWYDKRDASCGAANLNGNRYKCNSRPSNLDLKYYLKWNSNAVSAAELLLRPTDFPHYDRSEELHDVTSLTAHNDSVPHYSSETSINSTSIHKDITKNSTPFRKYNDTAAIPTKTINVNEDEKDKKMQTINATAAGADNESVSNSRPHERDITEILYENRSLSSKRTELEPESSLSPLNISNSTDSLFPTTMVAGKSISSPAQMAITKAGAIPHNKFSLTREVNEIPINIKQNISTESDTLFNFIITKEPTSSSNFSMRSAKQKQISTTSTESAQQSIRSTQKTIKLTTKLMKGTKSGSTTTLAATETSESTEPITPEPTELTTAEAMEPTTTEVTEMTTITQEPH